MTVEEIKSGVEFSQVKDKIQAIINDYPAGATAFNRQFDFNFLQLYGISFLKMLPCPMLISAKIIRIRKSGKVSKPNAEEAFRYFNPGIEYIEKHRGADDAMHEASIVFELNKLIHFIK